MTSGPVAHVKVPSIIWALAFVPLVPLLSQTAPRADHHQHLFSPAAAALVTGDTSAAGISARDLIGLRRVLYGSDAHGGGNPAPREGWAAFRELPLTQKEFRTIAQNLAPYMRW